MRYLYGDSAESPFKSNVLEFVRDALDFSVYVLEADARICALRDKIEALGRKAAEDIEELETFERGIIATIEGVPKRSGSPLVPCAEQMAQSCRQVARMSVDGVRARTATDVAQLEAEEAAEREGCMKALTALLGPHDPPDATAVLHLHLRENGGYDAVRAGESKGLGLSWKLALGIPEGHLFAQGLRVERVAPALPLHAPELSGWIRKEIKHKPQHIARFVINDVATEGSTIGVRVCREPNIEIGFDIDCNLDTDEVTASRLGPAEDEATGEFDVLEEDVPKLLEMGKSIHASLAQLTRQHLSKATAGDREFRELPEFTPFVERLIDQVAPIIREIALHSFDPNELILRRQLGDGRREEIYVSRKTLRDKFSHLPPERASVFNPLALDGSLSRSVFPPAMESSGPEPEKRSELPRSQPPPPPLQPPATMAIPPPRDLPEKKVAADDATDTADAPES